MKRVLTIALSLAMILSLAVGCDKQTPPPASDSGSQPGSASNDQVIALVNGEKIWYSQLAEQMVAVEAMYSSLSQQFTKEELQDKLHESATTALNHLINDQILQQKISEFGISLTPEEETQAQSAWDQTVASVTESVQKTYPTLEGKDLEAMTQAALDGSGVKKDAVIEGARRTALAGKLKNQVTSQLPPPQSEQVEEIYQQLLEEQTAAFQNDPTAFEAQALSGDPLVYVPEDYRVIQEINLRFDDEVIQLLNEMKQYDTDDNNSYEEMLFLEYQRLQQEALPQLYSRLNQGESFLSLMEEIKPGSSDRYNYVSANTTRLDQDYLNTALSISAPGKWSEEALKMPYGYTVLFWADNLKPGARSMEEVRPDIEAQLQKTAQLEAWNNAQEQWYQEADIEVYEDLLGY